MSNAPDTKQCTNCKLEILSSNYTVHSVHCQRNFYLCSKCKQPVNYCNKAEHDKGSHVIVCCTKCQLELEKYLLDDHLANVCPDRKVKCQICDIEVKATDITEHEDYCGSRTEKCGECGRFVMLKFKSLHVDSNHVFVKLSDEAEPSPSWQYGRRTLHNFMPDLSSFKPVPIKKWVTNDPKRSRNSESNDVNDDSDEICRRNFDLLMSEKDDHVEPKMKDMCRVRDAKKTIRKEADEWPALSSLRALQISDEEDDNPTATKTTNSFEKAVDEETDLMYALQVSEEINSDVWKKDINKEGKSKDPKITWKPGARSELHEEKFPDKNLFEKNTKKNNEEPKINTFRNDFNYLYDKHESLKLPCEFCGDLIVSNDLMLHQSRCSIYMMDTYSGWGRRNRAWNLDEHVEKKIPCAICNKFFRLSVLEKHEIHCQKNPSKTSKNVEKVSISKNLKAMNVKMEQGLQNGLEPSSPQVTRVGTRFEWLSELSSTDERGREMSNNLSQSESGVVTKVSQKHRKAPSPPRR